MQLISLPTESQSRRTQLTDNSFLDKINGIDRMGPLAVLKCNSIFPCVICVSCVSFILCSYSVHTVQTLCGCV